MFFFLNQHLKIYYFALFYSTAQKKPNRERERERVQNGYRTDTRLKVRFPHEKNQNKNLDVLFDLYYRVVCEHCGRIDEDYVQSALSICLLKENHSKYHKMLCCTRSASACWLLVLTAPVLQPSFLRIRRTIFQ